MLWGRACFGAGPRDLAYEQPYDFQAATYRFWFGEDLHGYTESDNAGTVCVDFYVR